MTIAVPIILAAALAVSLYGQAGTSWPNYHSEQNEKSDQGDESKDKPDKSDESKEKPDKKSSEKSKSAQKDEYGKSGKNPKAATPPKGRRDAEPKRRE